MRAPSRKAVLIIGTAFVLVIVAVILVVMIINRTPSLIDTKAFDALPRKSASTVDTSHLAAGLAPPTNTWFSGIALQKTPYTVFPTPLGVMLGESTFSVGLPIITPSGDAVTGGIGDKVTVTIADATSYKVTRYDELSVDATYYDAQQKVLGTLTLTAGSPYVQFSASRHVGMLITSTLGRATSRTSSNLTFKSTSGTYVVAGYKGTSIASQSVSMPGGGLVSLYVSPSQKADTALARDAGKRITGGEVSYHTDGSAVRTTFAIKTDEGSATLYSLLPHQTNDQASLFEYDTLYGKQRMYEGADFTFTTPSVDVASGLDLAKLSESDKNLLVGTLQKDNQNTTYDAVDSYYAGKQLYRTAQLLELAEQLGESSAADNLRSKLSDQLRLWFDDSAGKKSFYYDTKLQSIVGEAPSFGSENDNDHHFHYGYFIYAASILAQYDKDFLKTYRPQIDLLVADIANYSKDQQLGQWRNFDPYFGHSWASGDAPFNDGNNQESSSEAINAWIGTTLWARQTGNGALRNESAWMLSNEVASTGAYWMDIDTKQAPFKNVYTHSLVSLNWSGKREYGTFFSAEPAAKLGIQLIPMSPTQTAISLKNTNLPKHIAEAVHGSYDMPFGDYLLMYNDQLSVGDRLAIAKKLPDSVIDGANSRTYLYASLLAQK